MIGVLWTESFIKYGDKISINSASVAYYSKKNYATTFVGSTLLAHYCPSIVLVYFVGSPLTKRE